MSTPAILERLKRIALAWPNLDLGESYGTPAFKVKGKSLAWLRADGILVIKVDAILRDILMQAEPTTYFITDHYRGVQPSGWTYLLVRLESVGDSDLSDLFERAWRQVAPKRLVAEYDKAQSARDS